MKRQIFYVHGGNSYTKYENFLEYLRTAPIRELPSSKTLNLWSSTLEGDLGDDYTVFKPPMPNKQNAKYEEWKIWFERHFEYLIDGVVLIGWSLGGCFLVKYLIENNTPFKIKAFFLLAAPFELDTLDDGGDFTFDTTKAGKLAEKIHKIYILHSKDDFVVPYEHALQYKKALPKAEFISFEDKNHFLVEKFPELLEMVKNLS